MRGGRKRVEAIENESKRAKSAQIQNCRTFPSSAAAFAPYLLRASYEDKRMLSSGRSGGGNEGNARARGYGVDEAVSISPDERLLFGFFFPPKAKTKTVRDLLSS
jgi:hypothetical protein